MSASQFTVYSSSDPGNGSDQPGLLFGAAGDLLRILDKCLVNGYTGKAAAGWSKPFVNASNSGCYKQGAGALCALHIQDNGANVTSTFKEAWATGWETITATSATVGTGTGQFPTPAQLLTTGHVVIRKSNTADSTNGRPWFIYADSTTFYMFILDGTAALTYNAFFFGDVYSLKGSTDTYRCMIFGNGIENSGSAATGQSMDQQFTFGATAASMVGGYMPRTFGGGGTSIQVQKQADFAKVNAGATTVTVLHGSVPTPNGPDNSLFVAPIQCFEVASLFIRGRLRGLFSIPHLTTNFSDGQTFQGSNDYAGKTFQIIKVGYNGSMWVVETSATVETN
jgi:hypothetical protein